MIDFSNRLQLFVFKKQVALCWHYKKNWPAKVILLVLISSLSINVFSQDTPSLERLLTREKTIKIAQQNDDWVLKSKSIEHGLYALSYGATTLPDPTVSLNLLNLPSNGFAFNQEPMTQLKLGVSQQLSRGNTLNLQQKKYEVSAQEQPFLRSDRKQKIALNAELLWLDAYQAQSSFLLIEYTRPLFNKLSDIVSARYSSSVSSASQQDITRAELELMRLQERLINQSTQKQVALKKLSQYLFSSRSPAYFNNLLTPTVTLPTQLHITDKNHKKLSLLHSQNSVQLYHYLSQHSLVLAIEQRIKAFEIDTQIAKESKKPQYAINASYAFRDNDPSGKSRSDFFSVGVSMSMPLFSSAKQDAQVASSIHIAEAIKTEKQLLIRELLAAVESAYTDYLGLSERLEIYEKQIIPQMKQHSNVILNAYTNDTGDFTEVVRAKIAELDAQLTLLKLKVAKHRTMATINYYLPLNKNQSVNNLKNSYKTKQAQYKKQSQGDFIQ